MKIHANRRKSLYIRFLLSFSILGIFLVTLLSIVLSYSYERQIASLLESADRKILKQVSYSFNYLDDSAKIFATTLFSGNLASSLMFDNDLDIWSAVNILDWIRLQQYSTSSIHSVYVYNRELDTFYSTVRIGLQSREDFFDREIADLIRSNGNIIKLKPIPRIIPAVAMANWGSTINVFTYILPDTGTNADGFPSSVIVNVKADYLMETVHHLTAEGGGDDDILVIIDEIGRIVGHSSRDKYLTKFIDSYNFPAFDGGSEIVEINGERNLITTVGSEQTGWKFIKASPYRIIMRSAIRQRALIIAICGLFLSAGAALTILLSRSLYRPIHSLVRQVRWLINEDNSNQLQVNELKYIASAFSNAVSKAKHLNEFRRDNIGLIKTEFFREILNGMTGNRQEIERRMIELELNQNDNRFFRLLLIKLDIPYAKQRNANLDKVKDSISFALSSVVSVTASRDGSCEVFELNREETVVFAGSRVQIPDNNMKRMARSIQDAIARAFHSTISVSISAEVSDYSHLKDLYNDVRDLINYRLIKGPGAIICDDDIDRFTQDDTPFPVEAEKKLLDAIRRGDFESDMELYTEISRILVDSPYDKILLGYTRLASSIFNFLNVLETHSAIRFPLRFSDFIGDLSGCVFIGEIHELFSRLFNDIYQLGKTGMSQKTRQNVALVISIIEKDFSDQGLNVQAIADNMNMSPVYLGRIFKENTSNSVFGYLTNIRLEKARKMLTEDNKAVKEISKSVGFSNTKYFFTKFKSSFGVTPSQYRIRSAGK